MVDIYLAATDSLDIVGSEDDGSHIDLIGSCLEQAILSMIGAKRFADCDTGRTYSYSRRVSGSLDGRDVTVILALFREGEKAHVDVFTDLEELALPDCPDDLGLDNAISTGYGIYLDFVNQLEAKRRTQDNLDTYFPHAHGY
jgi:hypothetical protein